MNKLFFLGLAMAIMVFNTGCDPEETITDITQFPSIRISDASFLESETALVPVKLTWTYPQEITVKYAVTTVTDGIAKADDDFTPAQGTLVFAPGDTLQYVTVAILNDDVAEANERVLITLTEPVNANLLYTQSIVTIVNDDSALAIDGSGFEAPEQYQGLTRVWEDDFSGDQIDGDIWTHEVGGGGWGNNELQFYTNRPSNSFQSSGYLIIEAKEEAVGNNPYTSARMISKDKFEFQYGRVDFRAKLPEGKGIWPALWMLGENIDAVSWPRCGEIDIMELIGSQPQIAHGTAHFFGSNNSNDSRGKSTFLTGGRKFSEEFHVFSIRWRENSIEWFVDNVSYFTLTPADINGGDWPFNNPFFFIMNVAVGGNWPGSPNASTSFPQRMIVDYVRVYQ